MRGERKVKVGGWLEVRSKEEILQTLDRSGCLDGTPFMLEMFRFCGEKFQVHIEDYWSGNVAFGRILTSLVYSFYYNLSQAGVGLGPAMRWLYDSMRPLWRGSRWPKTAGVIPDGKPTPTQVLGLQPGDFVRVKSHDEILQTVTTSNVNRGMYWGAELVPTAAIPIESCNR